MSGESEAATNAPPADNDQQMETDAPASASAPTGKKRPTLDMSTERERKRGKSMFGLLVGTLNKAKDEDKERNRNEGAKRRQEIEQRLQKDLTKEKDEVRRAEETKKEKTQANRKEEELALKETIFVSRRTRLPILASYLSTGDQIPDEIDPDAEPSTNVLAPPRRTHPPPIYFVPARLLPKQEAFLSKRKSDVRNAVEQEWSAWCTERKELAQQIRTLREHVAEEMAKQSEERKKQDEELQQREQEKNGHDSKGRDDTVDEFGRERPKPAEEMDTKGENAASEEEKKDAGDADTTMRDADGDDAVEY